MSDYTNLDLARALMSQKSTSEFSNNLSKSPSTVDMADASGCLAYIGKHAQSDNPNLMQSAVACYVSDARREAFYGEVVKLAEQGYRSKYQRKRHANNLAYAVVIDTVRCALVDKEKADILGVAKSTFCQSHAMVYEDVAGRVAYELSVADDVGGGYWGKKF